MVLKYQGAFVVLHSWFDTEYAVVRYEEDRTNSLFMVHVFDLDK